MDHFENGAEIARLRELAGQLLVLAKREHFDCDEDCWYSCPKSGECCDDRQGPECNCGADAHNAKVDAISAQLGERP